MNDATITLNVTLSDSVLSLKKQIEEWTGMIPSDQRLIYAGRTLGEDDKLLDYRVQKLSTIHLVGRLRGG
jgi:ubiquitin C